MFLTTAARAQATRREKAAWLIIEVVRFVITTVMWRFGAAPLHAALAFFFGPGCGPTASPGRWVGDCPEDSSDCACSLRVGPGPPRLRRLHCRRRVLHGLDRGGTNLGDIYGHIY